VLQLMPLYERAFVLKIGTTYFPYQKKRELSHTLVSAFSISYIYISCLALSLSLSLSVAFTLVLQKKAWRRILSFLSRK